MRIAAAVLIAALLVTACGSDTDRARGLTCDDIVGRTNEHPVPALTTRANRVLVHLPPCYGDASVIDDRYPVIYLLHGGGSTAEMWLSPGLDATGTIDALTVEGTIDPVIAVMPYGASGRPEFIGANGDVPEFDAVLAEIDRSFRTVPEPGARAIAGVSAGGTSAAYLTAESEATDFAALGLFMSVWGPALDERFPAGVADADLKPAVLVDIGADDGLRTYTDDMAAAFEAAGFDADMQVHPGDHDLAFVADRFPEWFTWLAQQL